MIMKSPNNNEPKSTVTSLSNIPLKASNSIQNPSDKINSHPRHISPFLQRNCDNPNSFSVAPYFKDDSDIRGVIEKIKNNENMEFALNYLTDYLETHPGKNEQFFLLFFLKALIYYLISMNVLKTLLIT